MPQVFKNANEMADSMNEPAFKPQYYSDRANGLFYRIHQTPSGEFYNDYDIQYAEPQNNLFYGGSAGGFKTLEEAQAMLNKHRPQAKLDESLDEKAVLRELRKRYATRQFDDLWERNKQFYNSHGIAQPTKEWQDWNAQFMNEYGRLRDLYNME